MFYRRYKKRFWIYAIIALVATIVAIVYSSMLISIKNQYDAIQKGEVVPAQYQLFENNVGISSDDERVYWRFFFNVDGVDYTSITIRSYSRNDLNAMGSFYVRYAKNSDGSPKLSTSETKKLTVGGVEKTYKIALSYEDAYFDASTSPSLAAVYFLIIIASALVAVAAYNYILIRMSRNVEKKGEFEYGIFNGARASRLGTNRYMSVSVRYKTAEDEWEEFSSPFTYYPAEVEQLKSIGAIGIKRQGKKVVIVEKVVRI